MTSCSCHPLILISSSNNTGSIVGKSNVLLLDFTHSSCAPGGVIGGLAAIVILGLAAFYVIRRRTAPRSAKERPVNLLHGDPDDNEPSNYQPPPYLQPEPYMVTAPTLSSASAQDDDHRQSVAGSTLLSDSLTSSRYGMSNQRMSGVTSLSDPRSATPETEMGALLPLSSAGLTSSRKSGMPRQLRAVNIVQHEDAGPSSTQDAAQSETIELPPAYTNLRREP